MIYSLLRPAIRTAFAFRLPIKELQDLVQMAYFHETRQHGLKMRQIAELFDVSMRKVALLSKRLKRNFLSEEAEHELPRRIEYMLWAEPISEARLCQALPEVPPEEIRQALERLIEQRRIRHVPDKPELFEVVRSEFRLVNDQVLARIDGLNNLLASVTHAVHGRFFKGEPKSFARTLSFRVRQEDLGELAEMYEEAIFAKLVELEKRARDDQEAESLDLSIVWAPMDYLRDALDKIKDET